ncbi:phage tail tape measure protein [Methylorubrum extorquens]|uniref:Phage tail tape measure protein, TP901 family n=1 Tax=Methylorubrum extorquens DSM 13060 TaxID=882800 RepID=H1KC60_METEX|nr:phage tail tape measure protein [Methylorubrum extorquens]EHP94877.1 phage tail tape measure protein, TP901 family [Methylorubrum extorquens DSM 13060]
MVVEELIAKLGLRADGLGEARKFVKALEDVRKAAKGAQSGLRTGFTSNTSGLGRVTKDFERAAAAARRFRQEAERASRVRYSPHTGGGFYPGARPGRAPGRTTGGGGASLPLEAGLSGAGFNVRAGAAAATAYGAGRLVQSSAKSSMDFERSMIEVTKATDATAAERKMYEERIMRLARDTGQNKQELAGMLAQAGFSGRPKDELMRFTEYGAGASKAWGTTPEATGEALAQIGNIYEANQKEIERIGDQINTMADKSASRETDLLEIVRRVGGTGRTAGMSSGDILGFGAGLKERGVQTEVAASGLESYINFLKLGEKFSSNADDGIKALGTTSDKLREAFTQAPTKTALDFLDKINNVKDPRKRAEILTNIFGKERQDDVERMASSAEKIRQNIEMINIPANYAGSTMSQLAEQLQNDVSKIDQATQQFDVLLKRMGDPLKQLLGAGAERANKALDAIEDRTFNKTASSRNAYDDLPGLDHMRQDGPTAAGFNERFGAAPASGPRMTFMPNAGAGIPSVQMAGKGKNRSMSLGYGSPAASGGTAPSFASRPFGLGGAQAPGQGAEWMKQSMQQTVQNITNNTNTGNDQRTQTANVTVNASGLEAVGASVLAKVQAGLSSMGASVVKGNTAATGASTAP